MKNWVRSDTVQLILDIEKEIKPDAVEVDGARIWPWIRIKLFFFFIIQYERSALVQIVKSKPKKGSFASIGKVMAGLREFIKLLRAGRRDILFVGEGAHRAQYESLSYNKFFDPIRMQPGVSDRSILMEYSTGVPGAFLPKQDISYKQMVFAFKLLRYFSMPRSSGKPVFERIAGQIETCVHARGLETSGMKKFFRTLEQDWNKILLYESLWKFILQRLKVKKAFTLCYYNDYVYSLNLAASKTGIETFEMQHGPISNLHLAYGSFEDLPASKTSKLLPDNFLTWDATTKKILSKSFPQKKAIEVGQPWLQFIGMRNGKDRRKTNVITYALQPVSEVGPPFPDFLVNWIKESSATHTWWFRLHPRQMHEKDYIEALAKDLFPGVDFEMEHATAAPLPLVLIESAMIITYISGVVIEAALTGIPSVAFHKNAPEYFSEYENGLIVTCSEDDKKLTWQKFQERINYLAVNANVEFKSSAGEFMKLINQTGTPRNA